MDGAKRFAGKNLTDAERNQNCQSSAMISVLLKAAKCLITLGKRLRDLNNETQISLINHRDVVDQQMIASYRRCLPPNLLVL